jgi:hypothetical protein
MTEEIVYEADEGPKQVAIFCNWCLETNDYTEAAGEYRDFVACAWCRKRLKVPRSKMMRVRLNGHRPGAVSR